MTRILAIFIAVFCFACPSTATILINCNLDSAPSAETNGGTYTGSVSTISLVVSGTGGDYFDHVTGAACWGGSGGCGKLNLSVGQGGGVYRGYTPGSYSGGTTQLNYRYLAKWNSSWNGANNLKGNYMTMGGSPFWTQEKATAAAFGSGFQMAYSYQGTLYRIHGNGQSSASCDSAGYECCPHEADCSLGDGVAAAGPFYFGDYADEWVCFEIELRSDGTKKLYIWTQNETYNGLYMQQSAGASGTPAVTGFGGAYFYDSGADDGAVLYIDEVIFADSYIGPPAGFTSGGETSRTATGVTFSGAALH